MPQELVPQLIKRIAAARGKQKLSDLLRTTKELHGLRIRTTGNIEDLEASLTSVVLDGHLSLQDVARLVDEIEENGAQHIFLFRLTDEGRAALTAQRLGDAFQSPPRGVATGFYGDTPRRHTVFIGDRPGELIVKEVYTGSFWELDEDESEDSPTRRVRVTVLRQRRAVNLLRIVPATGDVELRIDRLKGTNDKTIALEGLEEFTNRLASVLTLNEHLEPLEIRSRFPMIVAAEDETFMLADYAADASARQLFASRREGGPRGTATDIRRHPNYRLRGNEYVRDAVHVYWKIRDAGDRMIFSIISSIPLDDADGVEYTKVYFSARVEPEDLNYVLARVRHFATHSSDPTSGR